MSVWYISSFLFVFFVSFCFYCCYVHTDVWLVIRPQRDYTYKIRKGLSSLNDEQHVRFHKFVIWVSNCIESSFLYDCRYLFAAVYRLFVGYVLSGCILLAWYCCFVVSFLPIILQDSFQNLLKNNYFDILTTCFMYGGAYLVACFKAFDLTIKRERKNFFNI